MLYCLESICLSNIGRIRNNNEDNFYFNGKYLPANNDGTLSNLYEKILPSAEFACFSVFDGMGGHADGQIASYIAATSFAHSCQTLNTNNLLSESFFEMVVSNMNNDVCSESANLFNNMGTTMVSLGFCLDSIYICNVGDSRAYRYRNDKLIQISLDHVTTTDFSSKPRLDQCIGISPDEFIIEPYIAEGIVKENDIYLICSDGLTDMLPDEDIKNILSTELNISTCANILLNTALSNGGRDNITLILIHVKA